jgi:hypothetical protein
VHRSRSCAALLRVVKSLPPHLSQPGCAGWESGPWPGVEHSLGKGVVEQGYAAPACSKIFASRNVSHINGLGSIRMSCIVQRLDPSQAKPHN